MSTGSALRSFARRALRLDDPLGHLVPPGQVLTLDLIEAVRRAVAGAPEVPSGLQVRLHPADRAWLPAAFERDLARAADGAAAARGVLPLDQITVHFQTDAACDPGRVAIACAYPLRKRRRARRRATRSRAAVW